MPMDFPSSPTVGQQYNGYVWTGTAWDSTSAQPISLSTTAPGYNYVINGGFDIWQRGSAAVNGIANATFHPDRWIVITDSVGTVNSSRIDVSAQGIGSQYGWRLERTAGTNRWVGLQMVEGALSLVGKTVTISGYIRKGSALTSSVNVHISTRTAKFGTVVETPGDITIANSSLSTTTFTRFTQTFNITTATSTAGADLFELEIFANQAGAANAYFDVAGVQIEQGSTATAFRRNAPSIQAELAACQRYYYRRVAESSVGVMCHAVGGSTTSAVAILHFPVNMRIAPTSVEYNPTLYLNSYFSTNGAISSISLNTTNTNTTGTCLDIIGSSIATDKPYKLTGNGSSTAYLGFSAEL